MKKTNEFVLEFGRLLKAIQQKKRLIILYHRFEKGTSVLFFESG